MTTIPPVSLVRGWVWPPREQPRPWRPSWAVVGPAQTSRTRVGCPGTVWPTDPGGVPYPCRWPAGHRHRCEPGER